MKKFIKGTLEVMCGAVFGAAFAYMMINGLMFELYGL